MRTMDPGYNPHDTRRSFAIGIAWSVLMVLLALILFIKYLQKEEAYD